MNTAVTVQLCCTEDFNTAVKYCNKLYLICCLNTPNELWISQTVDFIEEIDSQMYVKG